MNRLKLLVFALIALGLWGAHLSIATPAVASKAVDQASLQALGAPLAIAQRIEASRSQVQAAALKLASSPVAAAKPVGKVEAPNAERLNAVRAIALEAFAEADRAQVVVGVVNEAGAMLSTGTGDGAAPPEGFDAKAVGAAGGAGQVVELNGARVIFFSVPVISVDKTEVKPVGTLFVGAPLLDAKSLDALTKELRLTAVGVFADGKSVSAAGAKPEQLDAWFKQSKAGQTAVVETGTVLALGPARLPLFTGTEMPALEVGARREIAGSGYEVLAVASVRPSMTALAESQKTALFMLGGLLVAAIAFALIISNGGSLEDDDAPAVAAPKPVAIPEPVSRKEPAGPLPIADAPPPAEASPDDFQFGGPPPPVPSAPEPSFAAPLTPSTTAEQPAYDPAPSAPTSPGEDPFAAASPFPPPAPFTGPSLADDDFENQRTTAYPAHRPPNMNGSTDSNQALDPFAMAGGPSSESDAPPGFTGDFNPDATRVAAIPQELLNASRKQSNPDMAATRAMPAAPLPKVQPVSPVVNAEEQHFQDTFRDFVATREKCGEPADGITYEKFAAKLRKNREQLVAKYNCRTVRFQVYVKDGKAALKATPVKD